MRSKFIVFYPVSLGVLILQCFHVFCNVVNPYPGVKELVYSYLVLFSIGLVFYIYTLFLSIRQHKKERVFIILFSMGMMLFSQLCNEIILIWVNIWTFFSFEWSSLIVMNDFNMFAYLVVLLSGFIGLFLPRHIGYILSMIVPFHIFCQLVYSFFFTTKPFPEYLIANWQAFLVLMIIAPILYNRKIILDYFKVSLKQKFLYLPISFLIAALTVVWPYFKMLF